ncbi:MAG TPA: hypothetical protein VH641_07700 [Streptosporangiaceae bacterium]|jgi:rubrerythrin
MTSEKPPAGAGSPRAGQPAAAPRQRWNDHLAEDRPGDPACLLYRVCPACGSVADADPPTTCPQCQREIPAVP